MRKLKWILLVPIVYLLLLSLFSYFKYPNVFPSRFTFDYWINIMKQSRFIEALINSLIIGSASAILATLLGLMNGRYVVKYFGGYTKEIALVVSLPLLIPGMILFLGMHQVMILTRLANTYLGIILVHTIICIPYTTNIAIAYFTGIPEEYELAALVLGGSSYTTFKQILLPLLMPGILTSMMISFLISNTEYFSTFLIGGGQVITLSMMMFPYISQGDYGHSSVMGIVFIVIHMCLFLLVDRYNKNDVDVYFGGK